LIRTKFSHRADVVSTTGRGRGSQRVGRNSEAYCAADTRMADYALIRHAALIRVLHDREIS